ncbi:LAME_0A00496g1_1 [Lachancea meyersii CBS 8951]|uniref:LAME_0A00496g1_1 n=1 Tax=Lachancea meyersii CBS 8951 TaxID=1266667 RepID=A0A1G4IL64_9SACH|nr:LAME_0A00496g1_1 [Lachancea meyersii CBS 8951]
MSKKLELPECYEVLRPRVEKTLTPIVRVKAEEGATGIFDSKFGGNPYFPIDSEYPRDADGFPMKLLAQLNFEQIPHLDGYPTSGILQFYLSTKDGCFGFDYGGKVEHKNYRILFFDGELKGEDQLLRDFDFVKLTDEDEFPLYTGSEAKLTFTPDEEYMNLLDFRVEKETGMKSDWIPELEDFYTQSSEMAMKHKIGGYPGFTQCDPRGEYEELASYTKLLLQIDSDDAIGCEWGDAGVGNFFITEEDLAKRDFSKVYYNYDCC